MIIINEMSTLSKDKLKQFYLECQKDKLLGIDTEFYRVNSYSPELCLIQLSNLSNSIILDPIESNLDENFLKDLLFNEKIIKVFFAASQDIEVLFNIFKRVPSPLVDLQICISLIIKNYSLSYSAACKFFLAISINKNNQFIDWRKRPLRKDKILYAINDVKYLLPLYEKLNRELKRIKRNDKVNQLHKKISDPRTYTEKPKYAWKKLKFVPKTDREFEILKSICELREKVAIKKNIPIKWVIKNHEIKLLLMKKSSIKLKYNIIKKIKDRELREKLNKLISISSQ